MDISFRKERNVFMKKLRFCLVGAGSIGRRHLRLILERGDVDMAVAEPSDESFARIEADYPALTRYLSFDEALAAGDFDAMIIATPHTLHAQMTVKALRAGVNVFCEKPMSDSLEECVAMMDAARESGRVLSVGFMFRFDPFVRKVKELIDGGEIGNVVHYTSRFATYNTLKCSVTRHQENTTYSLVMDCIHDTDLLYYFLGRAPDRVFSSAYKSGDMERSSPQNVIDTVYSYGDGTLGANIHFDYVTHPQVHSLEIVGDRGYIQGDFMKPSVTLGKIDGTKTEIELTRDFDDVYRAEWDSFIKAVRGDGEVENPGESAIFSTLLMQCQKESATERREVSVAKVAERYGFKY